MIETSIQKLQFAIEQCMPSESLFLGMCHANLLGSNCFSRVGGSSPLNRVVAWSIYAATVDVSLLHFLSRGCPLLRLRSRPLCVTWTYCFLFRLLWDTCRDRDATDPRRARLLIHRACTNAFPSHCIFSLSSLPLSGSDVHATCLCRHLALAQGWNCIPTRWQRM